jgi:hypothetical protein
MMHPSHRVQRNKVDSELACSNAGTPWRYFLLRRPLGCYKYCRCRNAGKKVNPVSAFLVLVNCVNSTSAFQHQGQSCTAVMA